MMDDKILEIRSNITDSLVRFEEIVKAREAREKAERDAKWERERLEREKKSKEWKEKHPVLDKYTYISEYNYETYSWQGNYCNINFYEWSNINSSPRKFLYDIQFFRFLDDCKIMPTQNDVNKFKNNSGCYIVCKPGSTELIIGYSYEDMKSQYESV